MLNKSNYENIGVVSLCCHKNANIISDAGGIYWLTIIMLEKDEIKLLNIYI